MLRCCLCKCQTKRRRPLIEQVGNKTQIHEELVLSSIVVSALVTAQSYCRVFKSFYFPE